MKKKKGHGDDFEMRVINDEAFDDKSIKMADKKYLNQCLSMKLPCGHGIAPHYKSLFEYCIKQVSIGNFEIKCLICDKTLKLSMIKSMVLTDKQMYEIEMGLSRNYLFSDLEKCKECPKCGLFIENTGTGVKMHCPICNKIFCWKCKANWNSNAASHKDCECDFKRKST